MKILKITENNNGTCTMECEFSQEELNILLSYAVTNILKDQINKLEDIEDESDSVGC